LFHRANKCGSYYDSSSVYNILYNERKDVQNKGLSTSKLLEWTTPSDSDLTENMKRDD